MDELLNLLIRKKKGSLSAEEARRLQDLQQSSDASDWPGQVDRIWELSGGYRKGVPQPDVEAQLARFRTRIASDRREGPRVRRFAPRVGMAATVALVATIAVVVWYLLKPAPAMAGILASTSGTEKEVALPDGSVVRLLPNSTLRMDAGFPDGPRREVELEGAAFFAVAPQPERPFRVAAGGVHVEVLGTRFLLRQGTASDTVMVEVEEGTVALRDLTSGDSVLLTRKMRGFCLPGGKLWWNSVLTPMADTGEQLLIVRKMPLEEFARHVRQASGVTLEVPPHLRSCTFTGDVDPADPAKVRALVTDYLKYELRQLGPEHWQVEGRCR